AVIHPMTQNYVEKSIFQLSKLVISEKYKSQTAELEIYQGESQQGPYGYIWKQSRIIQALFFNEIGTEPIVRPKNRNNNEDSLEQSQPATDLSIQCLFTHNRKKEAGCRECLALHSKSLVIGTFHILLNAHKRPTVELYVFTSACESEYIMKKCKVRFCPTILSLDPEACQELKTVFPSDRHFLDNKFISDYSSRQHQNDNRIRITKNGLEPDLISRTLSQLSARRMSPLRHAVQFTGKYQQQLMDALRIVTKKEPKCVMVISHYNQLHPCIDCVLGWERDNALVIIDFSLTYATIVTDRMPYLECKTICRRIQLLVANRCSKYLRRHAPDIESHHRLLQSPYIDPLLSSCTLLFHNPSNQVECARCVRNALKVSEEALATTAFSSLLDASDTSLETTRKYFGQSTACHTQRRCIRIQQVPNRFCSDHLAYGGMTFVDHGPKNSKLSSIHHLTKAKMSVGIWPPNNKRTVEHEEKDTSFATETETSIWPSYSKIALVEFTSAPSEQLKCAGCLIQHSDVFLVYTADDGYSGYVWMRQAPSHVFQHCLTTHCIRLTYDDEKGQIGSPVGLRQWTAEDISNKSKKE
ncbi:unnamed protein product, partial [Albugo candida]